VGASGGSVSINVDLAYTQNQAGIIDVGGGNGGSGGPGAINPGTAVESTTWGMLKAMFR